MDEMYNVSEEQMRKYLLESEYEYEQMHNRIQNACNKVTESEIMNIHSYKSIQRIRQLCGEDNKLNSLMDEKEELLYRIKEKTYNMQDMLYDKKRKEQKSYEERIQGIYKKIEEIRG